MLCCSDAQIQNILNGPSFAAFSPAYYLIKTLKKWTALTNNSQREKEILKRLDRRGTNIGAVLGDEMVFWSFDDLSAFEVHRIEFKK
jgi:hypothetical protein